MSTPGRLEVGKDGRLTGPAKIVFNDPFPCVNGSWGSGAMQGALMHTTVGSMDAAHNWFNNPAAQASANAIVGIDGTILQMGPFLKGWISWHAMAANLTWYGFEFVDNGDTRNPLTQEQIASGAQLVEVTSRNAGFPLRVTDRPAGRGFGMHCMGGQAWGGHTCPLPGPRGGQRQVIVDLAKQVRHDTQPTWTTTGRESLVEVGQDKGVYPSSILRMTAVHDHVYAGDLAAYINGGNLKAPMPAGITLRISA